MSKYRWFDQGRPKPQPRPNDRFFARFEWTVIAVAMLYAIGWLIFGEGRL